jgi:hypothetical protein
VSTERLVGNKVGVAADLICALSRIMMRLRRDEAWLAPPYRRQRPATQTQPGPCLTQAPGTHTA